MNFDFTNDNGGGKKFKKGERYELVIASAKEGSSKEKMTPYLKLVFQTIAMDDAYDKTLWNTEKSAYRAKEWAVAMQFSGEGKVELDPAALVGIHLSAECSYTKADDGKEYVEWIKPLPVVRAKAAAKSAPASDDSVPF